jgi:hypothetical protein
MPFQDALHFLLTSGFPTFLVVAGVPLLLWYAAGKPKKRWPYAVALGLAICTLLTHEGGK